MHQQEERSSAFILMTCTFKFFIIVGNTYIML